MKALLPSPQFFRRQRESAFSTDDCTRRTPCVAQIGALSVSHLIVFFLLVFFSGCAGGVRLTDVQIAGGTTDTPDHVNSVSSGSSVQTSSNLTIFSRVAPYSSFDNSSQLHIRSPFVNTAEQGLR